MSPNENTNQLILCPKNGVQFVENSPIVLQLSEQPKRAKYRDFARICDHSPNHTIVEVERCEHTFGPPPIQAGDYLLKVVRFKVPGKMTGEGRLSLQDLEGYPLFDEESNAVLPENWTRIDSHTISFQIKSAQEAASTGDPTQKVVLTSPGYDMMTIRDAVMVALAARQEDLFEAIKQDLDTLKQTTISPDKTQPTFQFTGMKAYEILDACMDQTMLRYLSFSYDQDEIVKNVEGQLAGIDLQKLVVSGRLHEEVLKIAQKQANEYFKGYGHRPCLCGPSKNRTSPSDRASTLETQSLNDSTNDVQLQRLSIPDYLLRVLKFKNQFVPSKRALSAAVAPSEDLDSDGEEWKWFRMQRLHSAALCELIWSYWHEEGMLVQTMHAINLKFQNKLQQPGMDRLAMLNTSPLRPLSNLLWGYIQHEPFRLSVRRRNYEFDHHYGISLHGKAVIDFSPADSRKTFIRAFHRLLNLCFSFYRQVDDRTVAADAFPIKNALRDVYLVLAEGAHNQYGDLPWAARKEMLIEQYMLSLPEMKDFLGGKSMIPYREPWMQNVDTMKRLQSWTETSVEQFNTLARVGEQILLTIRFGDWNSPNVQVGRAFAWAVMMRPWVQEYVHSYESVTGVNLRDARQVDDAMPSVHLRRRLEAQTGRAA